MKTFFNHQEHEDSTWKIVYMDMITMLMILFLSLWVIDKGKTNVKAKNGDITLNKVEFEADDYFDPGKAVIKDQTKAKMEELFFGGKNAFPEPGLDIETGGRRVVLIHGHTDDQGEKGKNIILGFERALAVYEELRLRMPKLADNVGICSYADNFPAQKPLPLASSMPAERKDSLLQENRRRRAKNRRFEIIGQFEEPSEFTRQ